MSLELAVAIFIVLVLLLSWWIYKATVGLQKFSDREAELVEFNRIIVEETEKKRTPRTRWGIFKNRLKHYGLS